MILSILLQVEGGIATFLPFLLVIGVMYFFFFRPQMKRQKDEKSFQSEISKGMRVVTTSGIHGKILEVQDSFIILESENSRLKIERSAINKQMSEVYQPKAEKDDSKKSDKK